VKNRSLPDMDPSTISRTSATYSSILSQLAVTNPNGTKYSELFNNILEQVLARSNQHRTRNSPQNAAELTNHGLQMDWMNTNFEQSVLDASSSFDLASFDNFMLEYPYLVDHDENLGW
jgi:hypothetical protein